MQFHRFLLLVAAIFSITVTAEADSPTKKIGLIASLSGFAAPYGEAVRQGIELALSEIQKTGDSVELAIQDDQSDPTKVLGIQVFEGYKESRSANCRQLVDRPLSKVTERDGIPLLSCETMQDADFVPSSTYFVLGGKVAHWVSVYEPFLRARGLNKGAVIKFTSGFSQSIAEEMRNIFSSPGRVFAGEYEYQDLSFSEARVVALKLRTSNPDVTYVDGQPEGLANFLKRRSELGMLDFKVIGHSAIETAIKQKLVSPLQARNVYFLRRRPPNAQFAKSFEEMFKRPPTLSADLGYYAAQMAFLALDSADRLTTLRKGLKMHGEEIAFDQNQVARGIPQEIHYVNDTGEFVRLDK